MKTGRILFMVTLINLATGGATAAYAKFSPMDGFNKFMLDNGLTVYVKQDNKLPVVTVQLWIRAGSLDENDKNNGVSHFLEHMLFKGTKKYTVGDISKIVESNGGVINAGTSKEFTEYYIDIPSAGFEKALDIIADIAQNASFPDEELQKERMVILEEIKRSEDTPDHVLYDNFNKLLFTQTNYKYRIIGTSHTVGNMSRQDVIDYYTARYVPNNMTLVIAGDVDFKQTKNTVTDKFSYLKQNASAVPSRSYLIEPVKPAATDVQPKHVQQSYILCGFIGPDIDSDRQFSGDVLSTILGSGLSSRLYRKLREEKQLVYGIGSGFYSQQGSSIFYVSAVCEPGKVDTTIKEINNELGLIMSTGVTEPELDRAKEVIRSHWYFDQETGHGLAGMIGYWSTLNKLDMIQKYIDKIGEVNNDNIKRFLELHYTGLAVAVLNPEIKK
jgi:predicted Zn-dependent peptidase